MFTQSGRWNFTVYVTRLIREDCFNPSMPKAGVGIFGYVHDANASHGSFNPSMPKAGVGILKRPNRLLPLLSFNPSMPKAGVGIFNKEFNIARPTESFNPSMPKAGIDGLRFLTVGTADGYFVPIHLCPKRALEYSVLRVGLWLTYVSIHLCPKRALE